MAWQLHEWSGMARHFPVHPPHPERICWGCGRLCPAAHMACGNGKERTEHPYELFGEDWLDAPITQGAESAKSDPPTRG